MRTLPPELVTLLRRQEGAVTAVQARGAGVTPSQLRTLVHNQGWRQPSRGVLIAPDARDPFRASVRAALLLYPSAAACGITAARLHGLWGLPLWTPSEVPEVMLPAGRSYDGRAGVRLHSGLTPADRTIRFLLSVTTLARTVDDVVRGMAVLTLEHLVCLLDSALRAAWRPEHAALGRRARRRLQTALIRADARSESAFETRLRLLFLRAGLPAPVLQFEVFDAGGRVCARLDMSWPDLMLAVEADGRAYHDAPEALYRDRERANVLGLGGWTILRFTWADLVGRPEWVVGQVRQALTTKRATA